MGAILTVQLDSYGNESNRVPVMVDILDSGLEPRHSTWLGAKARRTFPVDAGMWGVRAKLASGAVVEKAVEVEDGRDVECRLQLHELSPHETNEWAYFTQPISRIDKRSFSEAAYRGAWIRLWSCGLPPFWKIEPEQGHYLHHIVSRDSDGVVYQLKTYGSAQYAVQVGGPRIPWKFIGVPPDSEVTILVRPLSDRRGHPLEVLVTSNNLDGASLLTFLRRSDVRQAQSLSAAWLPVEGIRSGRWESAELDYSTAIAVGYFLIRTNDFSGLDRWLGRIDGRFGLGPPRSDYAILQLWREIDRLRQSERAGEAPHALYSWISHIYYWEGLPVFSDGLRLLLKALSLFRNTRTNSVFHNAYLNIVNAYIGASDPFAVATTFTGSQPDNPSAQPIYGIPEDGPIEFVYPESN